MRAKWKFLSVLAALSGAIALWLWQRSQQSQGYRPVMGNAGGGGERSSSALEPAEAMSGPAAAPDAATDIQTGMRAARSFVAQEPAGVLDLDAIDADQVETIDDVAAAIAAGLVPEDIDVAGVLKLDGDNLTITDRVRSNMGREVMLADLPRLNINTQEEGIVYLRGYVFNEDQRSMAELVAATTEGVSGVVNELLIEPEGLTREAGL